MFAAKGCAISAASHWLGQPCASAACSLVCCAVCLLSAIWGAFARPCPREAREKAQRAAGAEQRAAKGEGARIESEPPPKRGERPQAQRSGRRARKSGFPPLKSLQFYPQRPRSEAKCRRCGRPSGARKKGARIGLLPEGGRGGRAARANRADEAPKSRPAERRRRGRAKYGRWRFVRQRAQRRAWRHDAGKGKAARTGARLCLCAASASQSDCKRAPEAACPLVRRMEYYEKKENSRDLTCRSREFLVQ